MRQDLRSATKAQETEDVGKAFVAAGAAMEEGDLDRAIELLSWAKSAASRSVSVREAFGIALYLAGRYEQAQRELLAYRRMSGSQDQNHVLADCARALGRPEKVLKYVDRMDPREVGADRYAEGAIVLAGDRADRDDFEGALRALDRVHLHPQHVGEHHLRVWYAAAGICERMGDRDAALGYLEAIATIDDEFLDVAERLRQDR